MTAIVFSPAIGPVAFKCFLSENHVRELEVTGNPVETGAEITDHAYLKPKKITVEAVGEDASETFSELERFQASRVLFSLVTGLTLYENLLIQSLDIDRDVKNGQILRVTVIMREVIIVSTGSAPVNAPNRNSPAKPGGDNSRRAATPSAELSTDEPTSDRASGTVTRGDTPSKTVPENTSLLKQVFL